jgi:hypothetical protein
MVALPLNVEFQFITPVVEFIVPANTGETE